MMKIAYFGGEPIGAPILEELITCGIVPSLIITNPDRPSGRGKKLTQPPVKMLAKEHDIEVFQPENLHDKTQLGCLLDTEWDLFVVVAYNHILPAWLINLPQHKTLNVHPSLLPALRGPSPIRTALLENRPEVVGVSIMAMDEKMDHGPIVATTPFTITSENWPLPGQQLDEALARLGGSLLVSTIPDWCQGAIAPITQDHDKATYTKKFSKTDGEITINPFSLPKGDDAFASYLKICAFDGWPGTFFLHNGKRIKIVQAELDKKSNTLEIIEVVPEGKPAISFTQWLQNKS